MLVGRRRFLVGSLGAAAAVLGTGRALPPPPRRRIACRSITSIRPRSSTSPTARTARLIPGALTEINHYLRDFRTEQVHDIDVALLDALHALYTTFDGRGNFEVISGYRSPRTNDGAAARDERRRRAQLPHPRPRDRRAPDERQDGGVARCRHRRCASAASATTPSRISSTSTRAPSAPGSRCAPRSVRLPAAYPPLEVAMKRIAIIAALVVVALAAVWFVSRPEPDRGDARRRRARPRGRDRREHARRHRRRVPPRGLVARARRPNREPAGCRTASASKPARCCSSSGTPTSKPS